jgi:hypothetical protein
MEVNESGTYYDVNVTRHAVNGEPLYQAVCECGWSGDEWKNKKFANGDKQNHETYNGFHIVYPEPC